MFIIPAKNSIKCILIGSTYITYKLHLKDHASQACITYEDKVLHMLNIFFLALGYNKLIKWLN